MSVHAFYDMRYLCPSGVHVRLIDGTRGKSDERLTNPAVWQCGQDGVAVHKLQQHQSVLIMITAPDSIHHADCATVQIALFCTLCLRHCTQVEQHQLHSTSQ